MEIEVIPPPIQQTKGVAKIDSGNQQFQLQHRRGKKG